MQRKKRKACTNDEKNHRCVRGRRSLEESIPMTKRRRNKRPREQKEKDAQDEENRGKKKQAKEEVKLTTAEECQGVLASRYSAIFQRWFANRKNEMDRASVRDYLRRHRLLVVGGFVSFFDQCRAVLDFVQLQTKVKH